MIFLRFLCTQENLAQLAIPDEALDSDHEAPIFYKHAAHARHAEPSLNLGCLCSPETKLVADVHFTEQVLEALVNQLVLRKGQHV